VEGNVADSATDPAAKIAPLSLNSSVCRVPSDSSGARSGKGHPTFEIRGPELDWNSVYSTCVDTG